MANMVPMLRLRMVPRLSVRMLNERCAEMGGKADTMP